MSGSAVSEDRVEAAIQRARAFVDAAADPGESARLEASMEEGKGDLLERRLERRAQEATDPCVALETFEALADARLLRGALADRVADRVRASQGPDGAWRTAGAPAGEDPAGAALPAFAIGPRHPLFLTSMLAAFLGRTTRGSARALDAAGAHLAERWSPDLVQGGSWHAIAGYAHFFSNVAHEASDGVLQWCGRELERGFRTGALDAVRVARVFVLCDARALPGARVDAGELVPAILGLQQEDGGWPASGGRTRVVATREAAQALRHLSPKRVAVLESSRQLPRA